MSDHQDYDESKHTKIPLDAGQNETVNKGIDVVDGVKKSETQGLFGKLRSKFQRTQPSKIVSLASLFRYATSLDVLLMFIGTIATLAQAIILPLMVVVFGDLTDAFTDRTRDLCTLNYTSLAIETCPPGYQLTQSNFFSSFITCNLTESNTTTPNFQGIVNQQINYIIVIGCISIILGYFQVAFWSMSAERQTRTIRQTLFRSILRKEIAYFDTHKTGELNIKLTDDVNKIRGGIGDKVSVTAQYLVSFITELIISFVKGWKLTLVIASLSPLLFIGALLLTKISLNLTTNELNAYGKAGAVAEEVLSSIRTVLSYSGQTREQNRYEKYLNEAKRSGIKKGAASGLIIGFWYGAKLIREEGYSIGDVIIVFFSIVSGISNLAQIGPHFQAVTSARAAAHIVWNIIDETSKISYDSQTGFQKDGLIGDIHFKDVHFTYPSRPGVKVLNGISFDVRCGQTVALVGSSGSGKSTCVQLLQRFYDPDHGTVLIDEHPVAACNLKWLREQIGVVSQEPILFQATIHENILFGKETATDVEVHEAAKMANAHDFIMTLPDKYETQVGERGATLSGGQKQRIAIARALIRDPKILLLDEATSALDNESEKIVQQALDRAAEGRTTLVIAHRLSTIHNADKIVVIHNGGVVEEGDHESLMSAHGIYFGLVKQQNLHLAEEEEQLTFERQESTVLVQAHQEEENRLKFTRKQSSTVSSLSPSVVEVLHGKNRQSIDADETKADGKEKTKKVKRQEKKPNIPIQMLMMNKPEWTLIVIGCIACLINGGIMPAFGVVLAKLGAVFQECDPKVQENKVLLYVFVILGLAVISFIVESMQEFLFACSGEALTKRLRSKAFRALLHQEVAYFDDPKNNTGALCTRLATEASAVQGVTGIRIGTILKNFASLGTGILIGFVYSWELTLLIFAFVPFMVAGGFLENQLYTGQERKDKGTFEDAGQVALESIQNIRTVVQLTKQDHFYEEYSRLIQIPHRALIKRTNVFGLLYALSSSVIYFGLAALFRLGAHLVSHGDRTLEDVLLCFNCIVFGAQNVGMTVSMAPDYKKAVISAENILELLKRKPSFNNASSDGEEMSHFSGQLQFNNVHFIYPNRPESIILKNFSLKINPGQKVALVGASGCGKSTTFQLVERFYDVNVGNLFADSKDIRNLNLQWYRSQIGIVSQEPVLFDMSIRENIAYGDNSRADIPIEEIIQVAKSANIHDFIQTLPDGYETNCGAKGTQLSGGQKQRIAIARALIRDPKILLLDEATSALDSESEKVVQEALDRAQENRTSITIAHRLSTIQNADMICVFHNGAIVESGTHQELIAFGGRYYRLAFGKLK